MKKFFAKNKILIIISLLVIILGTVSYFLFFNKDKNKGDLSRTYTNDLAKESYLVENSAGEFSYTKVKNNEKFELTCFDGELDYNTVDSSGNTIETQATYGEETGIYTVNPPKDNYKKGETYTLTIINGDFLDETLYGKKIVKFTIMKDDINVAKVKDSVKEVSSKNVDIKQNNKDYIIKTNNDYKTDDIIQVKEDDEPIAYYKVIEKTEEGYKVAVPEFKDVFNELDMYGTKEINYLDYIDKDNLEDNIELVLKETILDDLITEVEAAEAEVKVKVYQNEENLKFTDYQIKFEILPKSNKEYHKITFTAVLTLASYVEHDISLERIYTSVTNIVNSKYDLSISMLDKDLDEYLKVSEEKLEKDILNKIAKVFSKNGKEKKSQDVKLGTINIPLGLGFSFTIDAKFDIVSELKLALSFNGKKDSTYTSGFIFEDFKFETLKNKIEKESLSFGVVGEISVSFGPSLEVGVSFVNFFKMKIDLKTGIKIEASAEITKDLTGEQKDTIKAEGKLSFFINLSFNVEIFEIFKYERELYNYDHTIEDFKYPKIEPTAIKLNCPDSVPIKTLFNTKVEFTPANVTEKDITYIVALYNNRVIASTMYNAFASLKEGDVKITAVAENGVKGSCTVKVFDKNKIEEEQTEETKPTEPTNNNDSKKSENEETKPVVNEQTKPVESEETKPTMTKAQAITKLMNHLDGEIGATDTGPLECDNGICRLEACGGYFTVLCNEEIYDFNNLKVTMNFYETQPPGGRTTKPIGASNYIYDIKTDKFTHKDTVDEAAIRYECEKFVADPEYNEFGLTVDECISGMTPDHETPKKTFVNLVNNILKGAGVTKADLFQ